MQKKSSKASLDSRIVLEKILSFLQTGRELCALLSAYKGRNLGGKVTMCTVVFA